MNKLCQRPKYTDIGLHSSAHILSVLVSIYAADASRLFSLSSVQKYGNWATIEINKLLINYKFVSMDIFRLFILISYIIFHALPIIVSQCIRRNLLSNTAHSNFLPQLLREHTKRYLYIIFCVFVCVCVYKAESRL